MEYLYLLLTTSIWGSLYVITKIALTTIPPITLLMLRYAVASIVFVSILKFTGKKIFIEKENIGNILFIGIVGYFAGVAVQVLGVKYGGASLASLVNSLNPVFITLFAAIYLHEQITSSKIISILLGITGVYIIIIGSKGIELKLGVIFSILSVILWSLSSVIVKKTAKKYDPITITALALWIGTILSIPCSALELLKIPHPNLFSINSLLCIIYLGIIGTAVPNFLWNLSLSKIDASICSLFYPIQPIVSVVLGNIILHEKMNIQFWIGAIMIVAGLLLSIIASLIINKTHQIA